MPISASPALTACENAWLEVEEPANLSVATVVFALDRPVDFDCLKSRVEDRLMAFDRFRQRVEPSRLPLARPHWREYDDFSLADHLAREGPIDAAGPAWLADVVSRLLGEPLDDSRPLWQIRCLEGVGGGSALVLRIHQCIVDGTAAPRLAVRLADNDPARDSARHPGLEPLFSRSRAIEAAREGASHTRMLCRLITSRADRHNPLRGRPGTSKVAAWSTAFPIAELEARAAKRRASVPELLLTAVAMALRAEFHRRDTPVAGIALRAVVPFDLREDRGALLGTRLALALLPIPLEPSSPAELLDAMRGELEESRRASERFAVLGVQPRWGFPIPELEERTLCLMGSKGTLLLGILPAPPHELTICGARIERILWWPSLPGDLAVGISIVSYAERVSFGVTGDRDLIGDARGLAEGISAALERLD